MIGALILRGVLGRDHAADRRRDQHVDVEFQQLGVGDHVGVRIAAEQQVVLQRVAERSGNVDAIGAVVRAARDR